MPLDSTSKIQTQNFLIFLLGFQLYMDDAKMKNFTSCFKEQHFLKFFFTRLKMNDLGRFNEEFPYLSPCGRERNFVRCDDLPIVFNQVIDE